MGNQSNKGCMFCKNCGKEIRRDALFCGYCGKKIDGLKEDCKKSEYKKTDFAVSDANLETLISEENATHSAEVQNEIGGRFFSGEKGAVQDYEQAFKWLEKAAEQNHPLALYALSICYRNGYGISQDILKSIECLKKAADCNNALACVQLAEMYELGRDVEYSAKLAYEYYSKAAELGNVVAQEKLNMSFGETNKFELNDDENNQCNLKEKSLTSSSSSDKNNLKCFVIYAYNKKYNEIRQCEIIDNVIYSSEDLEAGIMYEAKSNHSNIGEYYCRIFCIKKEYLYDFISMTEEAIDNYGAELYKDEDFFASYAFVDKYAKLFIFAHDLTEAKEIYNSNYQNVTYKFKIPSINIYSKTLDNIETKIIKIIGISITIGIILIGVVVAIVGI